MNIITVLMALTWILGLLMGTGLVAVTRSLRRMGTTYLISVDPASETWTEKWVRRTGPLWSLEHGGRQFDVPANLGKVYSHSRTGRKMLLVDGQAGVPVTLDPNSSRAVHPNGEHLRQIARDISYKELNQQETGLDVKTLALAGLAAVTIVGIMVIVLLVKVGKIAAAM